ncbi:MAG: dihydropteroate synthase [Deltaproteobacteria bacterium]|nr:dihydropteroate synthase [Deltaproteobacteria bacterium]
MCPRIRAKRKLSAKSWKIRDRSLSLEAPLVMGILNVTPDSFSDGGLYLQPDLAVARARQIAAEGADILDIGAESTRPGASPVAPEEEWGRLEALLRHLLPSYPLPVSIDTRHASVARRALAAGVSIVNDVSGGRDPEMLQAAEEYRCGYVLMHMRGEPENMMKRAQYQNVAAEVLEELRVSRDRALECGISPEKLCFDPGFGFAKTPEQNWQLLQGLEVLQGLGGPILVGLSRKRMLRDLAGDNPSDLTAAGLAVGARAIQKGADILRVHEVGTTRAFLQTLQKSGFSLTVS